MGEMVQRQAMGRPTLYSDELVAQILTYMIEGIPPDHQPMGLRAVSRQPGMPSTGTICNWLASNKEFLERYTLAKRVQAEVGADLITEIADTPLLSRRVKTKRRAVAGSVIGPVTCANCGFENVNDVAEECAECGEVLDREAGLGEVIETEVVEVDNTERSRLMIDSRKWIAQKLLPQKYGERLDLNHGAQDSLRALLMQAVTQPPPSHLTLEHDDARNEEARPQDGGKKDLNLQGPVEPPDDPASGVPA